MSTTAKYYEATRELEAELGVELSLGYIGNTGPGYDDRAWDVCIKSMPVPRHRTEGRGPWSHRASGTSYPSTRSWGTDAFPTVDELKLLVRDRHARELYAVADAKAAEYLRSTARRAA
jgi:hypothetical protein